MDTYRQVSESSQNRRNTPDPRRRPRSGSRPALALGLDGFRPRNPNRRARVVIAESLATLLIPAAHVKQFIFCLWPETTSRVTLGARASGALPTMVWRNQGDLDFKDGQPPFEALKGASGRKPLVVVVSLDRPAVLTNVAPLAASLVADFGVSDAALLDVLTGKAQPAGTLPFELPSSMEAVRAQAEELPHDSTNPLFRFGFGLRY